MAISIQDFILKSVPIHPKNLVAYVAEHFHVSPQAIHKHLAVLVNDGLIRKTGKTRNIFYELSALGQIKMIRPNRILAQYQTDQLKQLQEDVVWQDIFKPNFSDFPKNVIKICTYGLTEILNNARDHSEAKNIWASATLTGTTISLVVHDDGIGIFKKIKDALNLGTERESILHLSKGKFTTDPLRHTGEGIFFSSRSFDKFYITTPDLSFLCTEGKDWLFDKNFSQKTTEGTWITMEIDVFSKTELINTFNKYTMNSDIPSFEKTHVVVKLGLLDEKSFISRSQAKRILLRLDRFKEVLLDFRDIVEIGPSFADEIFRVFQLEHPKIKLTPVNTDPAVDGMIKRALLNLKNSEIK